MYEKFYGFTEKPFNITPDPHFLYLGEHHQEALAHLIYGINERKGFIVVTGEVGTGKTTLIHTLLGRLEANVKTALIFNPNLTLEDFFLLVFDEFELETSQPTKAHFLISLNNFLLERSERGENAVLIIDEAQNLPLPILEEIRLLLNLETAKDKLLQIVLAGQPELHHKLNLPELRQLKQRISIRYHIPPLNRKETGGYIRERLRIAGSPNSSLFTDKAINEIFKYSKGIPRLINVLGDNALLLGYADDKQTIDHLIVRECVADLELKRIKPPKRIEPILRPPWNPFKIRAWWLAFLLLCILGGSLWWNKERVSNIFSHLQKSLSDILPLTEKTVLSQNNKEPDQAKNFPQVIPINKGEAMDNAGQGERASYRIVTVGKNEWLSEIILKRYGTMNDRILASIKKANSQIKDINYIQEGWKIILPDINNGSPNNELYSVHIASFKKFSDAHSLFTRLTKRGYEVYLIPVNLPQRGRWYRVTLKKFKDEKEALRYAKQLMADRIFQYAEPVHISEIVPTGIEK
jgi:general secretion pathway protein A